MFQKKFSRKPSGPAGEGRGPVRAGSSRPRFFQKKTCRLCAEKPSVIDFKDSERLKRFLTEKGKIISRRITGNCAKCQRILARIIKRARHAAVLAFQAD